MCALLHPQFIASAAAVSGDSRLDFQYMLLELLVVDLDHYGLNKTLRNDAGF